MKLLRLILPFGLIYSSIHALKIGNEGLSQDFFQSKIVQESKKDIKDINILKSTKN
jgi:hypothetical protein